MAYEDRSYSGSAVPTTLTANISNVATSIPIAANTGWPDGTSGPFFIAIAPADNPDNFTEVIRCSGRAGLTLNVQTTPVSGRGWDGTTAQAHIIGAVVQHVFTATDADEANQHISNTSLDHHTQYLTVVRHDSPSRHGIGSLPTGGTPSNSLVGDTSQTGTSSLIPRSDHKHGREAFGAPVAAGPVSANGTSTSVPRSDHVHAGGIPIFTSTTRPSSPVTGQHIIESDTRRIVAWSGTRWQRVSWYGVGGRTECGVGRTTNYSIPAAGASSFILPWTVENYDTDGFSPGADGTTTYTLTIPSNDQSGLYTVGLLAHWEAGFGERSYIEVIQGSGTGGLWQYRMTTTGETHGFVTVTLDMAAGWFVQAGAYHANAAAQNISFFNLEMHRIGP